MAELKPSRLAYLIHTFPLFSITFIVDEIEAMRAIGVKLDLYGIRLPSPDQYPDAYQHYSDETIYALPIKLLKHLAGHFSWFVRHPGRYFGCLRFIMGAPRCGAKQRVKLFGYLCEAIALADAVNPKNYDHLHVHFLFGGSLVALFLKKLTGINYSVTAHGTDFLVDHWLLAEKINNAEFVRVGTHFNAAYITNLISPADADKLFVLPFGIDHNALTGGKDVMIKKIVQRNNTPVKIINVGRLVWQKGQLTLIEAVHILRGRGVSFSLEIIGEGELRKDIEELIAHYDLHEWITLYGALPRTQVLEAMQSADIFAFTSVSEGFGIVLLEAMSCGLAVVAPNITGVTEIVNDGQTGYVYQQQSGVAIADSLEKLIANQPLRQRYQLAALDDVLGRFDYLDKVHKLYQKMCTV